MLKNQKNNQKIQEKNLKQNLALKEKEINELKNILNTNISIKSQASSIYKEQKDEENSKENDKEQVREICSYIDNNNNYNLNIKKKKHKKKSLSLIERKLSSCNIINRRNLLKVNHLNKSFNSKNNSKRINTSKKIKNMNYNFIIINNSKIGNNLNAYSENKFKTINNACNSGSSTKRTKNDNSIKVENKIKKSNYYNYNSINSVRMKKLDKSISRSMPSKRGIEESFTKNYCFNINRSDINSNKIKKIMKDNNVIKNRILINYNTNIINTNISMDKSNINKKIKEFGNSLEEKINEITRNKNKRNGIKRTISAFYDKMDKYSIFLEKFKTRRENSFRHNNFYKIDKNNNSKIKKKQNSYGKRLHNNNGYDSNYFRKQFPQVSLQNKIKKAKKGKKMKIKLKDNSKFNIKNDISKDYSKNKFFIQAYTGKNPNEDKNNNKIIKNFSTLNIDKKIIAIKKNPNFETNFNRTIKTNLNNAGLTYRKYKHFNKLSVVYNNKNENKIKTNKLNINSSNNRINPSLRNFIFSKCIPNSKIS